MGSGQGAAPDLGRSSGLDTARRRPFGTLSCSRSRRGKFAGQGGFRPRALLCVSPADAAVDVFGFLRSGGVRTSSLLPRVPGAQNLSGALRRVRVRDRLELLHASHEAVGHVEIAELIGRHAVGAAKPPRLTAGSTPAVQEVALLIELQNARGRRITNQMKPA